MSQSNCRTLLLTTGLLLLSGCEQLYNGGISLKLTDQEQVDAYQQFKDDQARQLDRVRPEQPVAFPDPAARHMAVEGAGAASLDRAMPVSHPTGGGAALMAMPVGDAPMRTSGSTSEGASGGTSGAGGVSSLGLYGSVGDAAFANKSSPLDSPGDITQMTFTVEGADFDPDVDPAGQFIVYASTRHRDTADLYVKRIDGSAVTQLTADPADEVMPTFSPDGKWIAFASNRGGTFNIYLMPAQGGQSKQLTADDSVNLHPSFSPDGRRLVYCSLGSSSGQWEMIVIDVANPSTRRVVGHGLFPSWNPLTDTILFQRARQRGTKWFSVWTMDLNAQGEPMPPTEIAVSANAAVITPEWSPDGRQVVFCTVIDPEADQGSGPAQADLWVTAADGTGRVKLTSGRYANLQPSWSSDGTIFFVSDRAANGIENIWAVRPGARALDLARPAGAPSPTQVAVPTE